jgi:hypothetical protein
LIDLGKSKAKGVTPNEYMGRFISRINATSGRRKTLNEKTRPLEKDGCRFSTLTLKTKMSYRSTDPYSTSPVHEEKGTVEA